MPLQHRLPDHPYPLGESSPLLLMSMDASSTAGAPGIFALLLMSMALPQPVPPGSEPFLASRRPRPLIWTFASGSGRRILSLCSALEEGDTVLAGHPFTSLRDAIYAQGSA